MSGPTHERDVMFTEQIELRGHILDSLLLPKVLDLILEAGANFHILSLNIGQERADASYALIEITGPTPERVEELVGRLRAHGAMIPADDDATLVPAPEDGVLPPDFYVTTNQPTFIRLHGQWIEVAPMMMDGAIAVASDGALARCVKFHGVHRGMLYVTGRRGIRVVPLASALTREGEFEFMTAQVSSEKPKSVAIREVALAMHRAKTEGGKILVVAGPAVIHTGAGEHLEKLIQWDYVDLLFAGNALAVHDIEHALFGTSLGVPLQHGGTVVAGHDNHLRAINTIRAVGGIARAVESGLIDRGVMFQCVRHDVEFVLAGSIRDDGPLPEVITDVIEAQRVMQSKLEDVDVALMLGTMLHSIAVGNLLPATVRTICVDINPAVITKLSDRGTLQATGLVTDLEPFLRELVDCLTHPALITEPHAQALALPA